MKRNWMIAALLLVTTVANALVVSVNGYGEIPAGGMELTLTEAEEDIMSGKMRMETAGPLLCSGELTVTISRSNTGLADEFCCADHLGLYIITRLPLPTRRWSIPLPETERAVC